MNNPFPLFPFGIALRFSTRTMNVTLVNGVSKGVVVRLSSLFVNLLDISASCLMVCPTSCSVNDSWNAITLQSNVVCLDGCRPN